VKRHTRVLVDLLIGDSGANWLTTSGQILQRKPISQKRSSMYLKKGCRRRFQTAIGSGSGEPSYRNGQ